MGTKEDHRSYCFQDVKDHDKEYIHLWAVGKKVATSVQNSQSIWISVLWRKKTIDELTIAGKNMNNILGTSGMLIFLKQLLVCS